MFGNGENAPAQRVPEYNMHTSAIGLAAEVESDIVQAAKQYESARRELQQLQRERDKIEESIKQAIHRQEDAAMRMTSIIQSPQRN